MHQWGHSCRIPSLAIVQQCGTQMDRNTDSKSLVVCLATDETTHMSHRPMESKFEKAWQKNEQTYTKKQTDKQSSQLAKQCSQIWEEWADIHKTNKQTNYHHHNLLNSAHRFEKNQQDMRCTIEVVGDQLCWQQRHSVHKMKNDKPTQGEHILEGSQ